MQIYGDKLFKKPAEVIAAFDKNSFLDAFKKIENYKSKYFLLGYIRYEAHKILNGENYTSKLPLLYFEVFDKYDTYIPKQNNNIIMPDIAPLITKEQYFENIDKIKNFIKNGITYEVNYTYPSKVYFPYDSFDLYETLLKNQKTPYNAYISNQWEEILSFSPELFFQIKDGKIVTKPMKGTMCRGNTEEEDIKNIQFLKNDVKNQSENIMIVDLLRNDLSRIAKTGTVNVEKLYEIETHKTVHQMISVISAELENNITLYDIIRSLFPCGSITGAPKLSTMRVIEQLEPHKRDIYCGAIGFISPNETTFSVPIRILQRHAGDKYYIFNSGGAVVWDSSAVDEWEETKTKGEFLNVLPEFKLVETMKSENGKILFFKEHINRLKKSAKELGFKFDNKLLDLKPSKKDEIIRITLSKSRKTGVEYREIKPAKTFKVRISKQHTNSLNPLLYYKTDYRPWYEKTMTSIHSGEVFDEIYLNEKNEVTEGGRSNIIIEKDGRLYTPPVHSGILNGIYRQAMIDKLEEKVLYKNDLLSADKIYCINSVRAMVEVELCL